MAKTTNEKLQDKLFAKKKSAWHNADNKKVFSFAASYMDFLAVSKVERAASSEIVHQLKKSGFKDSTAVKTYSTGDKLFYHHKKKSVLAWIVGKDKSSFRLIGSHIDSPRLDIKPHPLYEGNGIAMLKTHYYGGVKKYQWTNIDLALYGVIHTAQGKRVDLCIGEKDDEPKFLMSDLLPHLAKKQMEKNGKDIVEGEQMNIFVGHIPLNDEKIKEKVKFAVLNHLQDQHGLVEEDFHFAEMHFVPAGKPSEIGFDKSLIAGYGQDDKSCSYANMRAVMDIKGTPSHTAVAFFSDKEEIGSMGNTGAHSFMLWDFAQDYAAKAKVKLSAKQLLTNSKAISADVTAAVNPNFSDVHDDKNSSLLGHGVSVEKYTGSGGKYGANDTHAEYLEEIRKIIKKHKITYQTGGLGKVDLGGGGTIALYMSRFGMDIVDAGPAVLGMHSPREVMSKVDLYEAYRLYKAFMES